MNRLLLTTAMALSLGLTAAAQVSVAQAQTPAPVGGPDAKGNAPLKHAHTVNDGSAKPGANSFTEGQARQHIMKSGYSDVTGLSKGNDGVWRATATKNGASVPVAMDFKGNVTEGGSDGGAGSGAMSSSSSAKMGGGSSSDAAMGSGAMSSGAMTSGGDQTGAAGTMSHKHMAMRHHHHHRRHHHHGRCANPTPDGAACSGVSTLQNGVSDKETHAMQTGAHP